MSWEGIDEVEAGFEQSLFLITQQQTPNAITELLIVAAGYSASMTPIATSNLINSQFRKVDRTMQGWRGRLGYGASYAVYVHEAPGKLLGTNTPRSPASDGNVWDPSAEPKFLEKGVEEALQKDLKGILRRNYVE